MSLRAERSSTVAAEGVRRGRQRLPVPVSPMCSETLNSYLRRVTDQNLLRPGWLSQLSRQPHFVADLVELTGLTERGLVAALPELRTPHAVKRWPHLVGHVSKRAGIRSACRHCAAAQTQSRSQAVTVFASHEQVLCTVHQQWTGSSALRCDAQQQFSVRPVLTSQRTPRTPSSHPTLGPRPHVLRLHRRRHLLLPVVRLAGCLPCA